MPGEVPQQNVCIFDSDEAAKKCTPGELAWFRPSQWGNAQLPLSVAVVFCDTNHQVIYNEAGVVCVFTNKRLHLLK